MRSIARAVVRSKIADESYEAVAVELGSHQKAVAKIVEVLFAESELVKSVALRHDKYKPATMRAEGSKEELTVGFRGHPYMLSFSDFEDVEVSNDRRPSVVDVAVATAIGRLHHFINIRDVDSFVYTMALVKSYLGSRGAYVKLSELKNKVLRGLLILHIGDMIAGFVEQALLKNTGDVDIYDTESLETIEPHIPLATAITFAGDRVELRITLHGLSDVLRREVLENGTSFELEYPVYKGTLRILGESGRADFKDESSTLRVVHTKVIHKRRVIMDKIGGR
ncbi:MAG: hypothetical protein QXY20_09220 [Thermofilum sp.]|uniref:hypothetical protein n=1 Tax=Thermofilum sp. TaxID=1961369 RepID=UPI003165289A